MKRLFVWGITSLAIAACDYAAAPEAIVGTGPALAVVGATITGSYSTSAVLDGNLVVEGSPVTATIDFGFGFSTISQVDFFFTFGANALDPGECLFWTAGFCNVGSGPQTSRLLTIDCTGDPASCDLFRDGAATLQLTIDNTSAPGTGSIEVSSLVVTVHGSRALTSTEQCKNNGWETWDFKNQGQCVRFVETGKDSRPDQ
jgi:hypothetical protein